MSMSEVFYKVASAVNDKVPGAGPKMYEWATSASSFVELAVVAGLSLGGGQK